MAKQIIFQEGNSFYEMLEAKIMNIGSTPTENPLLLKAASGGNVRISYSELEIWLGNNGTPVECLKIAGFDKPPLRPGDLVRAYISTVRKELKPEAEYEPYPKAKDYNYLPGRKRNELNRVETPFRIDLLDQQTHRIDLLDQQTHVPVAVYKL